MSFESAADRGPHIRFLLGVLKVCLSNNKALSAFCCTNYEVSLDDDVKMGRGLLFFMKRGLNQQQLNVSGRVADSSYILNFDLGRKQGRR